MTAFTVSRPGQANTAGDPLALFLKVFSGEVLTAFTETNVAMSRHMVRTISSGKSAQFPASWKNTASYHTPGAEIDGNQIAANERVITIDSLLISPVFIASIDEAMSHYDFRAEYSRQCGAALSRTFDKNVLRNFALAARASATVTGGDGGTQIVSSTAKTNAGNLITAILDALQALDEKNVPREDRYIFLKPDQYYLLLQSGDRAINRDLNPEGNGSVASGQVFRIGGAPLVMTNNLPSTDDSALSSIPAAYRGNFANTACIVAHRSAVGTVKLIDLATEMEYSVRHQGTLVVAKYAVGHGILRPESAVEIVTA